MQEKQENGRIGISCLRSLFLLCLLLPGQSRGLQLDLDASSPSQCKVGHWCVLKDGSVRVALGKDDKTGIVIGGVPGDPEKTVFSVLFPPDWKVSTERLPVLMVDAYPPIDLERTRGSNCPVLFVQADGGAILGFVPEMTPGLDSFLAQLSAGDELRIRVWTTSGRQRESDISLEKAGLAIAAARNSEDVTQQSGTSALLFGFDYCPLNAWNTPTTIVRDEAKEIRTIKVLRDDWSSFSVLSFRDRETNVAGALGFLTLMKAPVRAAAIRGMQVRVDGRPFTQTRPCPDEIARPMMQMLRAGMDQRATAICVLVRDGDSDYRIADLETGRSEITFRVSDRGAGDHDFSFPLSGFQQRWAELFPSAALATAAPGVAGNAVPSDVPSDSRTPAPASPAPILSSDRPMAPEKSKSSGADPIIQIQSKVTGSTPSTVTISWILTISNPQARAIKTETIIQFLDADGFLLLADRQGVISMEPAGSSVLRGLKEVPLEIGNKVARLAAQATIVP